MSLLILFTTNHPFTHTGGETMFVGPELPYLAEAFAEVWLVPLHDQGQALNIPDGVRLDRTLANCWGHRRWWHYLRAPLWPGYWPELRRGLRLGGVVGAARVWRWAAVADATWAWMQGAVPPRQATQLYSYWRGGQTLAAVRWTQAHPSSSAVSRVHRYELYDEAFTPPFQPWTQVYARLARIVAIAKQGADYLEAQGVSADRLRVYRLGVTAAPVRTSPSQDGQWRFVSCSNVLPLKRVELIAQVLQALALRHPQRRLTWTHFGDGPSMTDLQVQVKASPPNLQVKLAGKVPNEVVLTHFQTLPVDLLLLLSTSEGLPVSIQEALAHGVPVLATDVGGVAEAVHRIGDNGALVSPQATIDDLVITLERLLLDSSERIAGRREAAWRTWRDDFNAQTNHAAWARELADLQHSNEIT